MTERFTERTGTGRTMAELSHTNPHTGETVERVFVRGPGDPDE